ncbi:TonB-dependent receptor [Aquimarina pacifica]|uniref:TonB-dependent receptor n=1 Tax=Aquimarina pacifica TaxID=1296415 RepID=UPI000470779A|nr:TonB-dependent receptor [Aquimarina pacifica]
MSIYFKKDIILFSNKYQKYLAIFLVKTFSKVQYNRFLVSFLLGVFFSMSAFGQEEDNENETLDTERVVIVKAYTPTISDAFKVKSIPVLNDSITQQKKELRYSIFSVPVASTYTPIKGKAANIDKPKPIKIYDNYATLGLGSFTSVLAEFYSNFQINRSDNAGIYLHHNSSQGGIEDVKLEDKYYNTFLDFNYTSRTRDYTYGIEAGIEHKLYNWYGLPETPILSDEEIEAIDPQQSYFGAKLGGKFEFNKLYFKRIEADFSFFRDAFKSKESHLVVAPTMEFEMGHELITTKATVDFLKGSFDREITVGVINNYQVINFGVHPSLQVLRDNLTLILGAELVYSVNTQQADNDLLIYPKITASYRLLDDNVIVYGGLEGMLRQNTYRDAVKENPFVSPTMTIQPTDNPYDAYIGLKGKIADVLGYNIKGSYNIENSKPLFVSNSVPLLKLAGFDHGNSFAYRYDNVKTIKAYGELNVEVNKKFFLGASVEVFDYTMENEQEPWNLPEMKSTVFLDYQVNKNWFFGAQLFHVGERKDIDNQFTPTAFSEPITVLDSYFDANVNLGYRLSERLSFFVKGNNLTGQNYEQWVNFPVQGLQVLGGATYKFDY